MSDLFNPALVTGAEEQQRGPVTEPAEVGFDWHSEFVITQKQPRSAVYRNALDQITIRQEGDYPDDDVVVVFNQEVVPDLIRALAEQLDGPNGKLAGTIHDALWKHGL